MKILTSFNSLKKILAALALPFFAGVSAHANAGDIPQEDPSAPCGTLHQVGSDKFIYNHSNFFFNVRFETNSLIPPHSNRHRSVNAGAIKYLALDTHGQGIWHDTGLGNYHSTKSYVIPVANNEMVRIAYCADTSLDSAFIEGTVFFDKIESDGEHNGPQGNVRFSGHAGNGSANNNIIAFESDGSTTPFIYYNAQPSGNVSSGSLTICPKDSYCTIE